MVLLYIARNFVPRNVRTPQVLNKNSWREGLESIQGHFVLDYNVNARPALQSLG